MNALKETWATRKQFVYGLIVGLVLGPFIATTIGWTVTTAFLDRSVHNAVVKEAVAVCEMRARAAVKDPEKLEYSARYDLANKWSKMPGEGAPDSDVVSGCTNNLAG